MDADIEPGKPWEPQLLERIKTTRAALLLVSPNLLKSDYVKKTEMPAFMERMEDLGFHLFWALLEPCDWQSIPYIDKIQAIGSLAKAVNQSATKADEQCRLIEIVETTTRVISTKKSPCSTPSGLVTNRIIGEAGVQHIAAIDVAPR